VTAPDVPAARRGRGRPSIGREIKLAVPDDLLADIDAEAKRRGITRADEIRRRCDALARLAAGAEHRSTTPDVV
jgi:hypothetical protein